MSRVFEPGAVGDPDSLDAGAQLQCARCESASDDELDHGLCRVCSRDLGIAHDYCLSCGSRCGTVMGEFYEVSDCCRGVLTERPARLWMVVRRRRKAVIEGAADTAEHLTRVLLAMRLEMQRKRVAANQELFDVLSGAVKLQAMGGGR